MKDFTSACFSDDHGVYIGHTHFLQLECRLIDHRRTVCVVGSVFLSLFCELQKVKITRNSWETERKKEKESVKFLPNTNENTVKRSIVILRFWSVENESNSDWILNGAMQSSCFSFCLSMEDANSVRFNFLIQHLRWSYYIQTMKAKEKIKNKKEFIVLWSFPYSGLFVVIVPRMNVAHRNQSLDQDTWHWLCALEPDQLHPNDAIWPVTSVHRQNPWRREPSLLRSLDQSHWERSMIVLHSKQQGAFWAQH